MSNEDKRITMEELLEDRKTNKDKEVSSYDAATFVNAWVEELNINTQDEKENWKIANANKDNGIECIMKYFAADKTKFPCVNKEKGWYAKDLEDKQYNADIYKRLGWSDENHYDVINSFWTVFKCALIVVVGNGKYSKDIKERYYFGENSFPKLPYGKEQYGKFKISYPLRYLQCLVKLTASETTPDLIKIVNEACEKSNLQQLAALCHCPANFVPCPTGFNVPKYSAYIVDGETRLQTFDFLNLMIDLIQMCCEKKQGANYEVNGKICDVPYSDIKKWHDYFAGKSGAGNVRELYCLEDYYTIDGDVIKGKKMFDNQSLTHPVPLDQKEVKQCLENMVLCIENRAEKLAKNNNNTFDCPVCGEPKPLYDYSTPYICDECQRYED